jgi:hypothetical protein
MPLTDLKIREAKAGSKRIKISHSNGLYIEVRPGVQSCGGMEDVDGQSRWSR